MQKHRDLQVKLKEKGSFRGSVKLMPSSTAMKVEDCGKGAMGA